MPTNDAGADASTAAVALRALIEGATDWHDASRRIRNGLEAPLPAEASALKEAFDYHFPVSDGPEAPFGAQMESDGKRYPQFLPDVAEERLETWAGQFEGIDQPLVRARLGDFLWQRRHAQAFLFAKGSLEAYTALANQKVDATDAVHVMHRQDCLMRAINLALEINSPEIPAIVRLAVNRAADELSQKQPTPGVVIPILERLSSLPPKHRPDLSELILHAKGHYGEDPFLMTELLQAEASITTDATQKQQLHEDMVRQWIRAAEADSGLVTLMHLQRAHELAVSFGLSDLISDIRGRLGPAGEAANATYSEISTEIELPREKIDLFIDRFFEDPGWLIRLGHYVPLSGDPAKAERSAREQLRQSVVMALATTVITDDEGRVVHVLQTDEERLAWEITRQNVTAAQIWSLFAHDIMRRAGMDARPTRDHLVTHFTTEFISAEVADRIAAAFEHFWEDRFDEAVCIALPRLESIVREIAKTAGVPVFNEAAGPEPGMYRTLGVMLADLKGRMPADIYVYLNMVLSDPHAMNLRNRLCHGLLIAAGRQEAALTLHLAAVLATLRRIQPNDP